MSTSSQSNWQSQFDSFPAELRAERRWCVYRLEPKKGKPGEFEKRPYQARNPEYLLSNTTSDQFSTFVEALECFLNPANRMDGIGYVFEESVLGLDLDGCLSDKTLPLPSAKALSLIKDLPQSYTEVTPSGNGLHIFWRCGYVVRPGVNIKCQLPGLEGAEVYTQERYFTVTGNEYKQLSKAFSDLNDTQAQTLVARVKALKTSPPKIEVASRHDDLNKLGFKLYKNGLTAEEVEDALRARNKSFPEPKDEQELQRILRDLGNDVVRGKITNNENKPQRKLFVVGPASIAEVENEKTNWLVPNKVVKAEANLFFGDEDAGKSAVVVRLAADLTQKGRKVVIWCQEDSFGGKWKPRFIVAGADLQLVIPRLGVGASADDGDPLPLCLDQQEHIAAFRADIESDPGIALVVIDPLSDFNGECDLYKPTVRNITRPLKKIAQETGVAILVIHHTNKRSAEGAINAAAGNKQIMASVPNAFLFAQHDGERLMLQVRNKTGTKRNFKYRIVSRPWPEGFEPDDTESAADGCGLVEFLGKANITADELLQRKQEKDESEVGKVRRQIELLLKNGPLPQEKCWSALRVFGFSNDAINKACSQKNVIRDKKTWRFPEETPAPPTATQFEFPDPNEWSEDK